MPRFMLDTDTCAYIMKRSHPLVLKRLQRVPVGDVCMSVVTKAELLYGVAVSPRHAQDAAALAAFLPYVEALDLDEDAAIHYAEIRADLKKRGRDDRRQRSLHRGARAGTWPDAGDEQRGGVRTGAGSVARELDITVAPAAVNWPKPSQLPVREGEDT